MESDPTNSFQRGIDSMQRLLRCFAELDASTLEYLSTEEALEFIQNKYELSPEEALTVIQEKESEWQSQSQKWSDSVRLAKDEHNQGAEAESDSESQSSNYDVEGEEEEAPDEEKAGTSRVQWLSERNAVQRLSTAELVELYGGEASPHLRNRHEQKIPHLTIPTQEHPLCGGSSASFSPLSSPSSSCPTPETSTSPSTTFVAARGRTSSSSPRRPFWHTIVNQSGATASSFDKDGSSCNINTTGFSQGNYSPSNSVPSLALPSSPTRKQQLAAAAAGNEVSLSKYLNQETKNPSNVVNAASALSIRITSAQKRNEDDEEEEESEESSTGSESTDDSDDEDEDDDDDSEEEDAGDDWDEFKHQYRTKISHLHLANKRKLAFRLYPEYDQLHFEGSHSDVSFVAAISTPQLQQTSEQSNKSGEPPKGKIDDLTSTKPSPFQPGHIDRAPLVVVAVIDRSSSMKGSKMELVKKSLRFLVSQLNNPEDRIGIVSYDGEPRLEIALTQMTANGKMELLNAVDRITTGIATNLSDGFFSGIKLLHTISKSSRHITTAILLFTDGLANQGLLHSTEILEQTETKLRKLKRRKNIVPSVFTFGFGSSPDAQLLSNLAEKANGVYYAIHAASEIPSAFADCLGGLLSVFAENMQLVLEPQAGIEVKKIWHANTIINPSLPRTVIIELGDIYSEESRHVVFSLSLPSLSEPIPVKQYAVVKATLSYNLVPSGAFTKARRICKICRPSARNIHSQQRNLIVDKQVNRVSTAEAIMASALEQEKGNYQKAIFILQNALRNVQQSYSAADPFCKSLVANLAECIERIRKMKASPKHTTKGIAAFQHSLARAHLRQRSTHLDSCLTYRTTSKSNTLSLIARSKEPDRVSPHSGIPSQSRPMLTINRKSQRQQDVLSRLKRDGPSSVLFTPTIRYQGNTFTKEEWAAKCLASHPSEEASSPSSMKYLAETVTSLLERARLIYALIEDECTFKSCPKMTAGSKYDYLWADGKTVVKPISVPAPKYIALLFQWAQKILQEAPDSSSNVKDVTRRLFRVYAHIYHHHLSAFEAMGEMSLLQSSFISFMRFVQNFCLISERELSPMSSFLRKIQLMD
ncbi:metal ion binding [Balamuthia mandrillaris]